MPAIIDVALNKCTSTGTAVSICGVHAPYVIIGLITSTGRSKALAFVVNRRLRRTVANCLSSVPDTSLRASSFAAINDIKCRIEPVFLAVAASESRFFCPRESDFAPDFAAHKIAPFDRRLDRFIQNSPSPPLSPPPLPLSTSLVLVLGTPCTDPVAERTRG